MSRDIFVQPLIGPRTDPRIQQAMNWFGAIREKSHLDVSVFKYPTLTILEAFVKETGEPVLYQPVHKVYMMEALGPNPMASERDIARGLEEIIKVLHFEAQNEGIREIYYPSTDAAVNVFAQRHHFTLMDYEVPCEPNDPAGPTKQLMPFFKMKI